MIKLPKFTTQSMYDSETDFNLQMNKERISKFLIHLISTFYIFQYLGLPLLYFGLDKPLTCSPRT